MGDARELAQHPFASTPAVLPPDCAYRERVVLAWTQLFTDGDWRETLSHGCEGCQSRCEYGRLIA